MVTKSRSRNQRKGEVKKTNSIEPARGNSTSGPPSRSQANAKKSVLVFCSLLERKPTLEDVFEDFVSTFENLTYVHICNNQRCILAVRSSLVGSLREWKTPLKEGLSGFSTITQGDAEVRSFAPRL
jgi:hypothetical protein